MMFPDFTYVQFLSIVKHVMLCQRILLDKTFNLSPETRTKRAGYIFDFDNSPLTQEELAQACIHLTRAEIDQIIELGHREATIIAKDFLHMTLSSSKHVQLTPISSPRPSDKEDAWESDDSDSSDNFEAKEQDDIEDEVDPDVDDPDGGIMLSSVNIARDAALADAHDAFLSTAMASANSDVQHVSLPDPWLERPTVTSNGVLDSDTKPAPAKSTLQSTILTASSLLSIQKVLDTRKAHQSFTGVRSECTVKLDPKFLKSVIDPAFASTVIRAEDEAAEVQRSAMKIKEASHRVRVAQALGPTAAQNPVKKPRQLRWQNAVQTLRTIGVSS
ncbi:hypothetical protein EVG20_g5597, partial [Dentipellis fragilis]